jgi:L-seryl-tRNA(Ser) seleniumtransferase
LLFCHWEEIPALHMISLSADEIHFRAEAFCQKAGELDTEVIPGLSVIGGGSTPNQSLPTSLVMIRYKDVVQAEKALRTGDPAVVARIEDDRLAVDLRTVFEPEEDDLRAALIRAPDSSPRTY